MIKAGQIIDEHAEIETFALAAGWTVPNPIEENTPLEIVYTSPHGVGYKIWDEELQSFRRNEGGFKKCFWTQLCYLFPKKEPSSVKEKLEFNEEII
jgi:hypothetical protein